MLSSYKYTIHSLSQRYLAISLAASTKITHCLDVFIQRCIQIFSTITQYTLLSDQPLTLFLNYKTNKQINNEQVNVQVICDQQCTVTRTSQHTYNTCIPHQLYNIPWWVLVLWSTLWIVVGCYSLQSSAWANTDSNKLNS